MTRPYSSPISLHHLEISHHVIPFLGFLFRSLMDMSVGSIVWVSMMIVQRSTYRDGLNCRSGA